MHSTPGIFCTTVGSTLFDRKMNIETLLLCLIVCMADSVRCSINQMFFAEKMLENKAVMSNLLMELHNISPTQCSYVCLQQKCECFGFESDTKTCRIHAFCRLYSTSVDETGWKYYRSGQCCNFSFAQILYFAVVFIIANVILNHISK